MSTLELNWLDKSDTTIARSETSLYGHNLGKDSLDLPWICCLSCNYKDKIEFDLSLHMLEEHREELLQLPITRRERKAAKALSVDPFAFLEGAIEYRLDIAIEIAKRKSSVSQAIESVVAQRKA